MRKASQRFQPGDKVELFGLLRSTWANGRFAIVDQCVTDGVYVRIEGEEQISHVRHENCRLAVEVPARVK